MLRGTQNGYNFLLTRLVKIPGWKSLPERRFSTMRNGPTIRTERRICTVRSWTDRSCPVVVCCRARDFSNNCRRNRPKRDPSLIPISERVEWSGKSRKTDVDTDDGRTIREHQDDLARHCWSIRRTAISNVGPPGEFWARVKLCQNAYLHGVGNYLCYWIILHWRNENKTQRRMLRTSPVFVFLQATRTNSTQSAANAPTRVNAS